MCFGATRSTRAQRISQPAPASHPYQAEPAPVSQEVQPRTCAAHARIALRVPTPATQMRVPATRAGQPAPRRILMHIDKGILMI